MTVTPPPATQLVLVRHAQSFHNREGQRALGPNYGLTELGWRQAEAVAGWLASRYRPAAVVTSPLVRAVQTAESIAARWALPALSDERLVEADFAFWDELPGRRSSPLAGWDSDWQPNADIAPRYSRFRARLHDCLAHLLTRYEGQTIIAVTHGGVIGTVLRSLFGGHELSVQTENTGISQVTWDVDHWQLVFHNSTMHLAAPGGPDAGSQRSVVPAPSPILSNPEQHAAIRRHYERVAGATPRETAGAIPTGIQELMRLAAPRPADRVLDVGTGLGTLALALAPFVADVVGVDMSPAMLERAEAARSAAGAANVRLRLGEIGATPLADGSFEIIACHNLFKYAADLPALLRHLRRLLAPGGRLVADALIAGDDPVRRATQNAIEVRRDPGIAGVCSVGDLERDLAAGGFRIVTLERYQIPRELEEWLNETAADDATRSAVRRMLEAGLEADAAGMNARRNREGQLVFTETRARVLAVAQERQG